MFMSLFPQQPEFEGRSAVTFHNQRDFIFFRRHRYIFHNRKRVGLQELGPRFTVRRRTHTHTPLSPVQHRRCSPSRPRLIPARQLKLRSLQKGTFDTKFGEYEWIYRPEMSTSRRRFFL